MMTTTGRAGLLLLGALVSPLLGASVEGGVRLCVGSDQVLRLARSGRCAPGGAVLTALQERVEALSEQVAAADRDAASRTDELTRRLAALEAAPRTAAATGSQIGSRVIAPFEVVDKAGKTIFAVRSTPRGLTLSDDQGRVVVASSALAEGGFVKARSGDGSLETVMGVNKKYAGFVLRQGGQARGSFAIGEDGKPILNMSNDNFVTVVALSQGSTGGGYLSLGNAAGESTVEAGTTSDGVGLVRAYPLGNPGAGLVGMPGTFILGRKGR